jgi:hypothetical protein
MIRLSRRSSFTLVGLGGLLLAPVTMGISVAQTGSPTWVLIGLGDSLTHGTMDAHNNTVNTMNAYLQRVGDSLRQRMPIAFSQPFLDDDGDRTAPFQVPTNVGIDGEDSFSIEGLAYYKRAGTPESEISEGLLADKARPRDFDDLHDKVLYPIDLLARRPVSQIGAAEWLLESGMPQAGLDKAIVVYWVGNNDSSTPALARAAPTDVHAPPGRAAHARDARFDHALKFGRGPGCC